MEAVNYVNKLLNDASFQESTGSYREALRSYHLCHVQLSKLISLCKDENYKVLLKEKINFVQSKITSLTTLAKQNVSKTVTTIDPITKFPIPVSSIASATNRNPSQSQQNKQDGIQFAKSLPSVPKNDVKLSRTALVNRMNTVFDMNMDKNYSEMELSMRLDILNDKVPKTITLEEYKPIYQKKKAQEESMLQNYLNRPEETAEESLQRILDQQKLQKEIKMRMTPEEREELERKRKEEKKKRKEERKKKREEKREKKENKHLKQDNKQSIDTKSTSHSTKKHHFISSYLGDSIDSDSTSTGSSDSSDSESIISSDSSDYEDEYSSSSSSSSNSSSNDTDDYSY